ncbi:tetratricopeptide repeat protein [Aquirufa sp. KTFRIE-69F]|uniref:Tetratricopeptide repeat protein n=1 Tax=Aquirufa originis TaxID=3096514 RepID=A0ABW6DD79_9BACT
MKKILLLLLVSLGAFAQTAESYRLKAAAHFENGRYKEAIAALTLAIKLNPKDVKAWRNRAITYEKTEKFDLAVKDYLEVLKYDPSGETLGAIGFDYLVLEKYEEARKYLQQAITLLPTNINFRYNLALSHQYEQNYALAIEAYDEALKIDPYHTTSLISKTRCLLRLKQFDKASVLVDSFFVAKRFDVEMLLFRGDIKLHNGAVEAALNDFNRAIAINPEDLTLLIRAADCLAELSQFDEEAAVRKRIVTVMEKQGETKEYRAINYGLLGFALYNAFLWEEALENLSKSISLDPSATFYFYRTAVKAKLKDYVGACEDLKKAQELNPSEAENYEGYFADTAEFEEFYESCMGGV